MEHESRTIKTSSNSLGEFQNTDTSNKMEKDIYFPPNSTATNQQSSIDAADPVSHISESIFSGNAILLATDSLQSTFSPLWAQTNRYQQDSPAQYMQNEDNDTKAKPRSQLPTSSLSSEQQRHSHEDENSYLRATVQSLHEHQKELENKQLPSNILISQMRGFNPDLRDGRPQRLAQPFYQFEDPDNSSTIYKYEDTGGSYSPPHDNPPEAHTDQRPANGRCPSQNPNRTPQPFYTRENHRRPVYPLEDTDDNVQDIHTTRTWHHAATFEQKGCFRRRYPHSHNYAMHLDRQRQSMPYLYDNTNERKIQHDDIDDGSLKNTMSNYQQGENMSEKEGDSTDVYRQKIVYIKCTTPATSYMNSYAYNIRNNVEKSVKE